MHIHATLEKVIYKPTLCSPLETFSLKQFLSGDAFKHASFLLDYHGSKVAISHWISPKRTRSYPYSRVYDTMNKSKRVTIIPFVKDEGRDGDRDFIQWDTVSLMNLLGVYVIIGYYKTAQKSEREKQKKKQKITNQEYDYKFLKYKLDELDKFKSDTLHWNLTQLDNLEQIAQKAKQCYQNISEKTGVVLHNTKGIDRRIDILKKKAEAFKLFSRSLAESAQHREFKTIQPKESIIEEKAKITIKNYLGGEYYLTVDEIVLKKRKIFLIEKKHSEHSLLPSTEDVKDGFLKMILFSNLSKVEINSHTLEYLPVLGLTSKLFTGHLDNFSSTIVDENIQRIFNEGKKNKFLIFLMNSGDYKKQRAMIDRYIKQSVE